MRSSCLATKLIWCLAQFTWLALGLCGHAQAADKSSSSGSEEKRVALAKLAESGGVLFSRETGKAAKIVGASDSIYSTDMLLVLPAGRATFATSNKAATVSLWGNLPLSGPAVESAIVLHDNADFDLDFTLDRGRVLITNAKTKGEAKVRVRVLDQVWTLNLREPGTTVALEFLARMPAGTVYKHDAKTPAKPSVEVNSYVSKGTLEFRQERRMVLLSAPPGPASVRWSSELRNDVNPLRLDKVPSWLEDGAPYDATPYLKAVHDQIAKQAADKPIGQVLASLLDDAAKESNAPRATMLRNLAIFGCGATNDLPQLFDALNESKSQDVRESAIEALRHWLGRKPGNDAELDDFLVKSRKFEPKQAEGVVQLLNGFDDQQRGQAETYEVLIAYVKHPRLAVRELAHWHLTRLVPDGNKIKYDPAGPADEQDRAFKEWKKRVPDGKVPGAGS